MYNKGRMKSRESRFPLTEELSEEEYQKLYRACENFMGARGGNTDQVEFYRARAIDDLLAHPDVPEARKKLLRVERAKLHPKPLALVDDHLALKADILKDDDSD